MHYLIVLGHTLQTKNRLELDAYNWLRHDLDRTLIKKEELENMKKQVANQITALSESHSRCKPLRYDWYKNNNHKLTTDWVLNLTFATVHFYAQKEG
jgi:hypothetical protein